MLLEFETVKQGLNEIGFNLELINIDPDIFYYRLTSLESDQIEAFDSMNEVLDYIYSKG